MLLNVTNTWVVDPDNQLAAIYYSDEEYATGKKLEPLATALQAIFLAIVFLSIASRKFIGLELAGLFQLGFLSLLHNKEISIYLQPESTWGMIFGYNKVYFSPYPSETFDSPYALFGYH